MFTLKTRRTVTSLHHTAPHQTNFKKHYQFIKLKPESAVRINKFIYFFDRERAVS